jgi:hypothetical protein
MADPTGAPSPFEKQTLMVSNCDPKSFREIPLATCAFQILAPSRCRLIPTAEL